MDEVVTYDPLSVLIVIFLVIAVYVIAIVISVAIIRWIFRINKIVEVITDQAAYLEDIIERLDAIKNSLQRKPPEMPAQYEHRE